MSCLTVTSSQSKYNEVNKKLEQVEDAKNDGVKNYGFESDKIGKESVGDQGINTDKMAELSFKREPNAQPGSFKGMQFSGN